MLLVVDVTKGMQTQTAECLVIGQITCEKMIVVLNKVDLLTEASRQTTVEKVACNVALYSFSIFSVVCQVCSKV